MENWEKINHLGLRAFATVGLDKAHFMHRFLQTDKHQSR